MVRDQEYEHAVEKSTVFLHLMLANDTKATQLLDTPQSSIGITFTSVQDLAAQGYTG